jgi:hypothetical protein
LSGYHRANGIAIPEYGQREEYERLLRQTALSNFCNYSLTELIRNTIDADHKPESPPEGGLIWGRR